MKRLGLFLKATTVGGLFMLLPIVLTLLLISKAVGVARTAAAKIIGGITGQPSDVVHFPLVLAVLLVLALSFLLGRILTSQIGSRCSQWFEHTILFRVPGYFAVKSILHGLTDTEREGMVRPALVSIATDERYFAFVMEEHGDGQLTIFVPSSPSAARGSVRIVGRERVKVLNVPLRHVISALNQWGVGTRQLLAKEVLLQSTQPSE